MLQCEMYKEPQEVYCVCEDMQDIKITSYAQKSNKKKKKVVPVDEHGSAENRGSITDINYTLDFSSRANMLIRN